MTSREELLAALERERISYPDELEAERYRPGGVEKRPGLRSPYTPVTEEIAEQNFHRLARTVAEIDDSNRKDSS